MILFGMKRNYIYAELTGGLGNQIFIFEFCKYIASINGGKILLNDYFIDEKHSKGKSTIRDFSLQSDAKIYRSTKIFAYIFVRLKKFLKFINRIDQPFIFVLDENNLDFDKSMIYKKILTRKPKWIIILGFWQNFSYWDIDAKYELKNESKDYRKLEKILRMQNPIVFHYRLGVLNNDWEQSWGALSPDYLSDSLSTLDNDKIPHPSKLWVFSNDLSLAKILLRDIVDSSKYKLEFINDHQLSPAELIMLFSRANFLICSNSTFSLAAAKLGNNINVIIPASFSRSKVVDFSPPVQWTKVKSKWLDYNFDL
jgi:hypothetical protein